MAALEQRRSRRQALLHRQEDLEAKSVEADVDPLVEEALDVVEVVRIPCVGDLDLGEVDALLLEDLDLARAGVAGRSRVGHDRRARLQARAGDGAVDLLDVLGDAGLVGGAFEERGLDVGALDPLGDVVDEELGDHVGVARHEEGG